ncbi:MAG TPA: hypothetical protein VIK01_19450 [Polyangiaceae bacterium]
MPSYLTCADLVYKYRTCDKLSRSGHRREIEPLPQATRGNDLSGTPGRAPDTGAFNTPLGCTCGVGALR